MCSIHPGLKLVSKISYHWTLKKISHGISRSLMHSLWNLTYSYICKEKVQRFLSFQYTFCKRTCFLFEKIKQDEFRWHNFLRDVQAYFSILLFSSPLSSLQSLKKMYVYVVCCLKNGVLFCQSLLFCFTVFHFKPSFSIPK